MNQELERAAIERLRAFVPKDGSPYYLCYSGGKDSDCIRILADLAGVPHTIEHNLTTVDAPETVRYVKSIPGVHINRPRKSMWQLIIENGFPPTQVIRYCCEELKERFGLDRIKLTGVRWSESVRRKKNRGLVNVSGRPKMVQKIADEMGAEYVVNKHGNITLNMDNAETRRTVEHCYRTTSVMVNPIIDWEESDVWEFLHHYGCASNPLYQDGFKRVGCVGCPMSRSSGMKRNFIRWPKYRQLYVHAFDRMIQKRIEDGKPFINAWGGVHW